jgi:hypothetical protein
MRNIILIILAQSILLGCLSSEKESDPVANTAPDTGNTAPTISGTPAQNTTYGEMYEFRPSASDADGDELTFSVSNKPGWANFDVSTGRLSGQPSLANMGDYSNIVISVSDGTSNDSLPAYTLSVVQAALGSVELSWTAPTQNSDGSPLMDLAGYKLYYRKNSGSYDQEISIDNPSVTTYLVEQLSPATYYFAATSKNSSGVESAYSAEVERVVQ